MITEGTNGLTNLGNTCFINACIQILYYTPNWNELLKAPKYLDEKNECKIIVEEWNKLSELMLQNNCEISPNRFIYFIKEISKVKGKMLFADGSENDFTEFFSFFVEIIHELFSQKLNFKIDKTMFVKYMEQQKYGNNKFDVHNYEKIGKKCFNCIRDIYKKEYSDIVTMFYGLTYSTIISKNNGKIHSVNAELFFILNLPIIRIGFGCTLEECINNYILPEELIGENAWYNEQTKEKEDVFKQISFWSFPNILVISLKQFTDGNKTFVNFPINNLNLNKYVKGYVGTDNIYDLYAVANHFGNIYGGHYTAFIKNDKQWIHFDDKHTSFIDERMVVTPNAYCLFYLKRNYLSGGGGNSGGTNDGGNGGTNDGGNGGTNDGGNGGTNDGGNGGTNDGGNGGTNDGGNYQSSI
jgi:ubiquitin C-terminal hydrolase